MIYFDKKEFYLGYRKYFENRLTQGQVNGIEALFREYTEGWLIPREVLRMGEREHPKEWDEVLADGRGWFDARRPGHVSCARQLAYILATVYHETGKRMVPVREGFAETDAEAIRKVTRLCRARGRSNYALPSPRTGQSYFGRGPIQLTHEDNYRYADERLGMDGELVRNPSRALEPRIGAMIAVFGMYGGWFVPVSREGRGVPYRLDLWDYIRPGECDYVNARKIVNGLDSADKIAGHAERFEKCIREAA